MPGPAALFHHNTMFPTPTSIMVRYAILGTGLMGVEHLRNLMALADDGAGVVVTALADPHPASLAAAVDAWTDHYAAVAAAAAAAANGRVPLAAAPPPPPKTYPSAAALFAAEDPPPFDVLVVATPNYTHAAVVLAALAALPPTTHLLVEKPLCTTVADCRALVADAAARKWRGVLWNALEYRYMPAVAEVVRRTWGGGVGRVVMAALREHRFPFLEKVGGWNRFNCWSGGTLVEVCWQQMRRCGGEGGRMCLGALGLARGAPRADDFPTCRGASSC